MASLCARMTAPVYQSAGCSGRRPHTLMPHFNALSIATCYHGASSRPMRTQPQMLRRRKMANDLIIKNGRIIDGSGMPSFHGDVGIKDGKIVETGKLSGPAGRTIDAGGLVGCAGLHRQPLPLRRPGLLGPDVQLLQLPRVHVSRHRQLFPGAGARPRARPGNAGADAGARRGHSTGGTGSRRPLELGNLSPVHGSPRRKPGHQRGMPDGPLRHPPLCHGRRLSGARGNRR